MGPVVNIKTAPEGAVCFYGDQDDGIFESLATAWR